jgi:GxxExxY protein
VLLPSFTSLFFVPENLAHETREMTRKEESAQLIYKTESYAIIGTCFAVYKDKGSGFHEPIYYECLEIELEFQEIPFLSKPPQTLQYRGRTLIQTFFPDFLCYEKTILEIKAVSALADEASCPKSMTLPIFTSKIFASSVCFVGKQIFNVLLFR